jgi:hypothetical protein
LLQRIARHHHFLHSVPDLHGSGDYGTIIVDDLD